MTNDSRPYTCARGNSLLPRRRCRRRRGGYTCWSGLVVARVHAWICAHVYTCARAMAVCVRVSGRTVRLHTNPLDIPQPSQRYGCLFNMCNRQRAQIQSIKSINDSIVRSRRDTCASS